MVLLPDQQQVLVADAESLIGLDVAAEGKAKEAFKIKLEFKHRLGAAAYRQLHLEAFGIDEVGFRRQADQVNRMSAEKQLRGQQRPIRCAHE